MNRRTALAHGLAPIVLAACGAGGSDPAPPPPAASPPQIVRQPSSGTVRAGATALFDVAVNTAGTASYQWLRNGIDFPGATQPTLALSPVSLLDSGAMFSVRVANGAGAATSESATLTVMSPALTIHAGVESQSVLTPNPYVNGVGAAARFDAARPIAVDDQGNAYVGAGTTIRKVTPDGTVTTFTGSRENFLPFEDPAHFLVINELIFDRARQVLVAVDQGFGGTTLVKEIALDGRVTTVRSIPGQYERMTFAADGTLYVASGTSRGGLGETFPSAIYKVSSTGEAVLLGGNPAARGFRDGIGQDALFFVPVALAADGKGNVYVGDFASLRRVAANGTVVTIAGPASATSRGSLDGAGPDASFSAISDLAIDSKGNILVVDVNLIRRVTPDGQVTTIARSPGPATAAMEQIAFGSTGIPYIMGRYWVGRFEPFFS